MQAVLDDFLIAYDQRRPHQGRCMNGRTLAQALLERLLAKQPQKEDKRPDRKPAKHAA